METTKIPRILIYGEFDGHPIYRKGYKNVMIGLKTIDEISMGMNTLQWFITGCMLRNLTYHLPEGYFARAAELGLHIAHNTNFSADIAIFRPGQLKVGFQSVN